MMELAIQADKRYRPSQDEGDPEKEKQEAIAICKRKIDAAIYLFGEGRIDREEYLRRIEHNEHEIAHWEARTTETEKAALELAMCVDAVDKLARLWDMGEDEDKQGMARSLFSHLIYDLDTRQIVDFRLKPWADRFLVLRAALYEDEIADIETKNEIAPAIEGMEQAVPPRGYDTLANLTLSQAASRLLSWLYDGIPLPDVLQPNQTQPKLARNEEIRKRYEAGDTLISIGNDYGISKQRVHEIVTRSRD